MVAGVRCAGRGRKTWRECVEDDMSWVYTLNGWYCSGIWDRAHII